MHPQWNKAIVLFLFSIFDVFISFISNGSKTTFYPKQLSVNRYLNQNWFPLISSMIFKLLCSIINHRNHLFISRAHTFSTDAISDVLKEKKNKIKTWFQTNLLYRPIKVNASCELCFYLFFKIKHSLETHLVIHFESESTVEAIFFIKKKQKKNIRTFLIDSPFRLYETIWLHAKI